MSIDVDIDDHEWRNWMDRAQKELSAKGQDYIVEKTAQECRRDLITLTPKRTGLTRNAWQVTGSLGSRIVANVSKVMGFLEYGTPRSNPGGKIYPKNGKVLAIPNTSMAQTVRNPANRKPGSAGKFSFVRWVHGIKAMKIVEKYTPTAANKLLANVMEVLNRL